MATGKDEDALRAVLASKGLDVPPEWWAGIVDGWRDMQRMAALLRRPRDAEAEPATVFDVTPPPVAGRR